MPIAEALHKLQELHSTHAHSPMWEPAIRLVACNLEKDQNFEPSDCNYDISDMLEILLTTDIDDQCLEASNIYSGIESLLICPVDMIRKKATKLVNKWRMSHNLSPVSLAIAAITARSTKQLEDWFGSPRQEKGTLQTGVLYGLKWAMELANCEDPVQRCYTRQTLWNVESFVLPGRNPGNISREGSSQKDFDDLIRDINNTYPLQNFWLRISTGYPTLHTHVDRWNAMARFGVKTFFSLQPSISSFSAAEIDEILAAGLLNDQVQPPQDAPALTPNNHYRYENDNHDCGMHSDFNIRSTFLRENASASFQKLMSKVENETEHMHSQIEYISLNNFKMWFDENTRICHGGLPSLEKNVEELHSAWPELLCMIESNVRKAILGKELYEAMRETLQNLENNFVSYLSEAHPYERELAYSDLVALRRRVASCEPEGRYWPSSCDLHRIQDKLMGMLCRPVKALWEMESTMRADQQLQLEAKTLQVKQLTLEAKAREDLIMQGRGQLDGLEKRCRTLKAQLDGAEQVAAAKAQVELEKQKSKYYQDVEKGISDRSSALRAQLDAARAEGLLHRQILADNKRLSAEMVKMKQEMAHLRAEKSQKEVDCKLAQDVTKAITEGYDQLKETNTALEARIAELEADLETTTEERDQQRNENDKLKDTKIPSASTQSSSISNHTTFPFTSVEEKNKKELQHLDSTIVVWKRTLAKAEAKKNQTKEKRDDVQARMAEVEKQIKESKEQKKPKVKISSTTMPWVVPGSPAQQSSMAPVQLTNPIVVASAVRRSLAEQEPFPALGSASTPANTLRGGAPAFSSMRIKDTIGGTNSKAPQPQKGADKGATGGQEENGVWKGQQNKRGGRGN